MIPECGGSLRGTTIGLRRSWFCGCLGVCLCASALSEVLGFWFRSCHLGNYSSSLRLWYRRLVLWQSLLSIYESDSWFRWIRLLFEPIDVLSTWRRLSWCSCRMVGYLVHKVLHKTENWEPLNFWIVTGLRVCERVRLNFSFFLNSCWHFSFFSQNWERSTTFHSAAATSNSLPCRTA